MSVGGRLIEVSLCVLRDVDEPSYRRDAIRLWCVDSYGGELVVYAEPAAELPKVGEEIWWQAGRIMFDRDRKRLTKVGSSHAPEDDEP